MIRVKIVNASVENIELTVPAHNKLDLNSSGISSRTDDAPGGKAVEVMSHLLSQWD